MSGFSMESVPAAWQNVPLPHQAPVMMMHLERVAVLAAGDEKALLIPSYARGGTKPTGYALCPVPGIKDDAVGSQLAAVGSVLQRVDYERVVPPETIYIRQSESFCIESAESSGSLLLGALAANAAIEIDVDQAGLRIINRRSTRTPLLALLKQDHSKVMPDMRAGIDERNAVYNALLEAEPLLDNDNKMAPVRIVESYPSDGDDDNSRVLQLLVSRMKSSQYPHLQPLHGYRMREYSVDPLVRTMHVTDYAADDGRPEITTTLTTIQACELITFAQDIADGSFTIPQ